MTDEEFKKDLDLVANAITKGSHSEAEDAAGMRVAVELCARFRAACVAVVELAEHIKQQKNLLK